MKIVKRPIANKRYENHEIEPTLWNRLIWQQALDQALKKQRDKVPNQSTKIQ